MSQSILNTIQNVKNFVLKSLPSKKHRYFFGFIFLFILIFGFAVTIKPALAQSPADWALEIICNIVLVIARLMIGLSIFFLRFFIQVAHYNNYINAPAVVMGWLMVRDVANMFFVVVLLVIAFGTILGLEQYEWKKTMGKFIFAAIFINFSKSICGLIIDIAHVFTITFLNAVTAAAGGNLISMFKMDKIFQITGDQLAGGNEEITFAVLGGVVMASLFALLIMLTMGAYTAIMVVRMVILWVLIILSPLAYIFNVMEKTKKYAQDWWSQFSNYVLVAPLMVFFLWLSFATLGAGDSVNEIGTEYFDNSEATKVMQQADANFGGATGRISISEVSTWENMASFFIAMGFMLVGLKEVGKLGVIGGNLAGSVMNTVGKVARYATGLQAAKWAGRQMGKGTLWGLKKIPFIGGDAWNRRYKTATAMYRRSSANRSRRWEETFINEMDKVGDTGKRTRRDANGNIMYDQYGNELTDNVTRTRQVANKIGAMFLEGLLTPGRVTKKVEDHEAAAKLAEEKLAESHSTSSSRGGEAKRIEQQEKDSVMRRAAGKAQQKKNKEEQRRKMRAEVVLLRRDREQDLARGDNEEAARKQNRIDEIMREYRARKHGDFGEITDDDILFANVERTAIRSKAEAENTDMEIKEQDDLEVAREKDRQILIKTGQRGGFEDEARAKWSKTKQERASVSTFDKAMQKTIRLNEVITSLEGMATRTPAQDAQLEGARKELNNLTLANVNRGSMFGMTGINRTLGYLRSRGIQTHAADQTLDDDNVRALQANALQAFLRESVGTSGPEIEAALARLEQRMGPAFVEQMVNSFNNMSEDGAVGTAGLFRTEIDAQGRTRVRRTDVNNNDDRDHIFNKRDWAASKTVGGMGKTGFDASLDIDSRGRTRIRSQQSLELLGNVFAGVTGNNFNRVDPNAINTIARAISFAPQDNSGRMEVAEVLTTLQDRIRDDAGRQKIFDALLNHPLLRNSMHLDMIQQIQEDNAAAPQP